MIISLLKLIIFSFLLSTFNITNHLAYSSQLPCISLAIMFVSIHKEMIAENLFADHIAINSYREIIRYIGDKHPTTRDILKNILAQ